jgi:K+-sensing histidine kinase KdpD
VYKIYIGEEMTDIKDSLGFNNLSEYELSELLKATHQVLFKNKFDTAAHSFLKTCKKIIGARIGYVALLNPSKTEYNVIGMDLGSEECLVKPGLVMVIKGIRKEACEQCETIYYNEPTDLGLPEGHINIKNVLFAPSSIDNVVVGYLGFANKEGGFNDRDAQIATIFANFATLSLVNIEKKNKIKENENKLQELFDQIKIYDDIFCHDVVNALQSFRTCFELISSCLRDPSNLNEINDIIKIGLRKVEYGEILSSNFRSLSGLKLEKNELDKVDVGQIIQNAIKLIQNQHPQETINVTFSTKLNSFYVKANKFLLFAFRNILDNSIKHNHQIEKNIVVNISKYRENQIEYIKIECIDNGNGIPDEMKKDIFYYDKDDSHPYQRIGLGLLLVKEVVDRLKGHIWVEDRKDKLKGTNFIILLPRIN